MTTSLPGNREKVTSRLGLGLATLMRESSRKTRERVFDAAYDVGYRHFDVAPLYGLGAAEAELGRLLKRAPGDATVATKFGLRPSAFAKVVGRVQGPLRRALARSTRLRSTARRLGGSTAVVEGPTAAALHESLEQSLRAMGLDHIDVALLHDAHWDDAWGQAWSALATLKREGRVGATGLAGDPALLGGYPQSVLQEADILQVPAHVFRWPGSSTREQRIIGYGLFSASVTDTLKLFGGEPVLRSVLENLLDVPLRTPGQVIGFLGAAQLASWPDSLLLVGTTDPAHVVDTWTGVQSMLPAAKLHLEQIHMLLADASGPVGRRK